MAPSAQARKKDRAANDYFEAGIQGRKTGITLKEQARDEHGLEAIEGLFSSPEKPAQRTIEDSGDDESPLQQEVDERGAEILSRHPSVTNGTTQDTYTARSGQPRLPPPRARSPIKTNLNSPARRGSLLPTRSSPLRPYDDSPSKLVMRAEKKRKLNFSTEDVVPSVERSPSRASWQSPLKGPTAVSRPPAKAFNLSGSYKSPIRVKKSQVVQEHRGLDDYDQYDEPEATEFRGQSGPNGHRRGKETDEADEVADAEEYDDDPMDLVPANTYKPRQINSVKKASVLPRGGSLSNSQVPRYRSRSGSVEASSRRPPPSRAIQQNRQNTFDDDDPLMPFGDDSDGDGDQYVPSPAKNHARYRYESPDPPQNATSKRTQLFEYRDPNTKISEHARERSTSQFKDAPIEKRGRGRPPKPKDTGPPPTKKPRTLLSANHESGKALDDRDDERGRTQSMSEEPQIKKRRPGRPKGAKNKPKEKMLGNVKLEKWETDIGVIVAPVVPYLPDSADGEELDTIDNEIAYASTAIETREVVNSNFRYAKTLSMPFFGCGLVDIPPGGEKRAKNSRKNHMVFFVHSGKVMVNVAGTKFRISQGGMWQVPRGNFYSIENEFSQPARLFFSQGCEMD